MIQLLNKKVYFLAFFLVLSFLSTKLDAQINFLKFTDFEFIEQLEVEYIIKSNDSITGKVKIQIWDFGNIIKYENSMTLDTGYFFLIVGDTVQFYDKNFSPSKEEEKEILICESILDTYVSNNDSNVIFSEGKGMHMKRVTFNGVRIITQDSSIRGKMYFHKKVPIRISVSGFRNGEHFTELIDATKLIVNHDVVRLE